MLQQRHISNAFDQCSLWLCGALNPYFLLLHDRQRWYACFAQKGG
jgi:hypothetical protein